MDTESLGVGGLGQHVQYPSLRPGNVPRASCKRSLKPGGTARLIAARATSDFGPQMTLISYYARTRATNFVDLKGLARYFKICSSAAVSKIDPARTRVQGPSSEVEPPANIIPSDILLATPQRAVFQDGANNSRNYANDLRFWWTLVLPPGVYPTRPLQASGSQQHLSSAAAWIVAVFDLQHRARYTED